MKATIEITANYEFCHDWTLVCSTSKSTKRFYLGQDVKFCNRVLGMSPAWVVRDLGTNRLDTESGRRQLAEYICSTLDINESTIEQYESWSLCAQ